MSYDNWKLKSDVDELNLSNYECDYRVEVRLEPQRVDEFVSIMENTYGATDIDCEPDEEQFFIYTVHGITDYESDDRCDEIILSEMVYDLREKGFDVIESALW